MTEWVFNQVPYFVLNNPNCYFFHLYVRQKVISVAEKREVYASSNGFFFRVTSFLEKTGRQNSIVAFLKVSFVKNLQLHSSLKLCFNNLCSNSHLIPVTKGIWNQFIKVLSVLVKPMDIYVTIRMEINKGPLC